VPRLERLMEGARGEVADKIVDAPLDLGGGLENEDGLAGREVDGMAIEAACRGVNGGPLPMSDRRFVRQLFASEHRNLCTSLDSSGRSRAERIGYETARSPGRQQASSENGFESGGGGIRNPRRA
jgi:hypothetical protein